MDPTMIRSLQAALVGLAFLGAAVALPAQAVNPLDSDSNIEVNVTMTAPHQAATSHDSQTNMMMLILTFGGLVAISLGMVATMYIRISDIRAGLKDHTKRLEELEKWA